MAVTYLLLEVGGLGTIFILLHVDFILIRRVIKRALQCRRNCGLAKNEPPKFAKSIVLLAR